MPADQAFQIKFANNDPSIPHNVAIKDAAGASVFIGDIFPGVETRTYDVKPLPAGTYQFVLGPLGHGRDAHGAVTSPRR